MAANSLSRSCSFGRFIFSLDEYKDPNDEVKTSRICQSEPEFSIIQERPRFFRKRRKISLVANSQIPTYLNSAIEFRDYSVKVSPDSTVFKSRYFQKFRTYHPNEVVKVTGLSEGQEALLTEIAIKDHAVDAHSYLYSEITKSKSKQLEIIEEYLGFDKLRLCNISNRICQAVNNNSDLQAVCAQYSKENLSSLNLWQCREKLTDAQLKIILQAFPDLETLSLFGCRKLTDAIGSDLAQLKKLKSLSLSCTKITDAIGPYLATLLTLDALNFSGCKRLKDAIGPHIAKLTNLRSLVLKQCHSLTNAILSDLEALKYLKVLNLSQIPALTDDIGPSLVKFEELESLDLGYCKQITSEIGPYITQNTHLRFLDLSDCAITTTICAYLPSNLEFLSFRSALLSDLAGQYLGRHTKLQFLNLCFCPKITNAILPHLEKLKNLATLFIDKTQITEEGIQQLKVALPETRF